MTAPKITFFCELDAHDLVTLFSELNIDDLVAMEARINLAIIDFSPERAAVVRQLNQKGIPVTAWLVLPKEQGYWLNLDNASQALSRYQEFIQWTRANELLWTTVGLDIEPDIRDVQQLSGSFIKLVPKFIKRAFNRSQLKQGRLQYQELVKRIHADGYFVETYQMPFIVDERLAKSTFLQKTLGVLNLSSDREVLMLYSSFLRPHGAGIIWSYGPEAQGIGVGSTGGGVDLQILNSPPLDWDELARDLRLAWVHSNHIYIFSLEGCYQNGYLARLKDFAWDWPIFEPAEMTERIERWRKSLQTVIWIGSHPFLVLAGLLGGILIILQLKSRLFKHRR